MRNVHVRTDSIICPREPPKVPELMKALDGQVPDGVNTSVGKQIDAGVVGGPPKTSG